MDILYQVGRSNYGNLLASISSYDGTGMEMKALLWKWKALKNLGPGYSKNILPLCRPLGSQNRRIVDL